MYKHVMVDSNNKVISVHYLTAIIPASGILIADGVLVELGWVYDPVSNTFSPPTEG